MRKNTKIQSTFNHQKPIELDPNGLPNVGWLRELQPSEIGPAPSKPSKSKSAPAPAPQTRAQSVFQGQLNPKKRRKIVRLEQWVEVRIVEGATVTALYPPNAQLIKIGQRMLPPPEFVYRRINFPDGIPPEYAWTCATLDDPSLIAMGGCGVQRMTVDTWLEIIDREAMNPGGHIGPTGVGNLPRPEETGECECPVCKQNRTEAES